MVQFGFTTDFVVHSLTFHTTSFAKLNHTHKPWYKKPYNTTHVKLKPFYKTSRQIPYMGLLSLPQPQTGLAPSYHGCAVGGYGGRFGLVRVSAKQGGKEDEPKKKETTKPSLFTSVTDALDFAQVRSTEDADLLEEAREATKSGGRMSRKQYGALRRKIGGTYKDFFKSYVEVDGQYVEEGWVDKTCKVCKKDTAGEARQIDKLGRYAHVSCIENPKQGNFFTRLFSR